MSSRNIHASILAMLSRIAPEADPDRLKPEDDIRRTLELDSFDFLNLIVGISDDLGVEIPEADYGRVTTLREMEAYIAERMKREA